MKLKDIYIIHCIRDAPVVALERSLFVFCFSFFPQAYPALSGGFAALLDELLEVGGLGVVLADVGLGLIAEVGLASGDEHGDMEPGSGVGGSLTLAEAGEVVEFGIDQTSVLVQGLLVVHHTGTDEHQCQVMAAHGTLGEGDGAVVEDGLKGFLILLAGGIGLLVVGLSAEDGQQFLLGIIDQVGGFLAGSAIFEGDGEVGEPDIEQGHLYPQLHTSTFLTCDGLDDALTVFIALSSEGCAGKTDLVTFLEVAQGEGIGFDEHCIAAGPHPVQLTIGDAGIGMVAITEKEDGMDGRAVPL